MAGRKPSSIDRQTPPPPRSEVTAEEHGHSCVHHWVLADPEQNLVAGHCKRCGAVRQFPGSPEGSERFDDYRELSHGTTYDLRKREAPEHDGAQQ